MDVKGAFDRVWWARLKTRLKTKGMKKKALKLLYNYLRKRFIQVPVPFTKPYWHSGVKFTIQESN